MTSTRKKIILAVAAAIALTVPPPGYRSPGEPGTRAGRAESGIFPSASSANAQTEVEAFKARNAFTHYKRITRFDGSNIYKTEYTSVAEPNLLEILIRNKSDQVLRYHLDRSHRPISYEYGRTFELFEFEPDGMLKRVIYYDRAGKLFGEPDFDDVAVIEFDITDHRNAKRKLRLIDSREEKMQLPERMQPVTMRSYSRYGELCEEKTIPTLDYWLWRDMKVDALRPGSRSDASPYFSKERPARDRDEKDRGFDSW